MPAPHPAVGRTVAVFILSDDAAAATASARAATITPQAHAPPRIAPRVYSAADLPRNLTRMLLIEPLLLAEVLVAVVANWFVPDAHSTLSEHILHVRACRRAHGQFPLTLPRRVRSASMAHTRLLRS